MKSGGASRTAVFVCQGRAAADGRLAPARFHDPVARHLLREDERAVVDAARTDEKVVEGGMRMAVESVRACAEVVAPRTVLIDDAVVAAVASGVGQVVIVGAGLDTRPWRLTALGDAVVYAVDHPSSQADALTRAAELPAPFGRMVAVPVDLARDALGPALGDAGHDADRPTVWVWEGVVPYLTRDDVTTTVAALAERSVAGSTLVVNYQAPSFTATFGRTVMSAIARMSGADPMLSDEPWRSTWTPQRMAALLAQHGWRVETDAALLAAARQIGSPTSRARSLANGHVTVARTV